jgi:hypothetical protein
VTKMELLNCIEEYYPVNLTYGWIRCLLQRRAQLVQKTIVAPSELPRLQVPRQYLNQYIDLIRKYVPLILAELIYAPRIYLRSWQTTGSC